MTDTVRAPGARRQLPRTRGALSGFLLVILGVWGALIPFVGPALNFSFTPDTTWKWTAARGWLEVLPGSVAVIGGLLLIASRSRMTTLVGAWFGIISGAWFVVGPQLAEPLRLGTPGTPTGSGSGQRAAEYITFFTGLGAVIVFLGATAFGRLSVVTVRDLKAAERRQEAAEAEAQAAAAALAAREHDRRDEPVAAQHSGAVDERGAHAATADQTREFAPAGAADHGRGQHGVPNQDPRVAQNQDPRFAQSQDPRVAQQGPGNQDPRFAQNQDPRFAQQGPGNQDPRVAPQNQDPNAAPGHDPRAPQNDPAYHGGR